MTGRLVRIEDAVKVFTYAISGLAFLSVIRNVELSYSVAFVSFFAISISFEYRRSFLLPRWALACMALGVILVTMLRMNAEEFVTLVVGALLLLLAVKLLGIKKFRDYMQIYLIALFLLIGSALLSTDIDFLLYFVCMIILVTVTVVLLTFFSQDATLALPMPAIARIASRASLISMIAIPVTVVMFILLPRTGYPVFHFLNKGTQAGTGFTDSVHLGKVSEIQEDTTVILRAHMERVPEELLYWRGVALDFFDGSSWTSGRSDGPADDRSPKTAGKQVRQTIYLEPYGNRYLFALDKPTSLSLRYAKKTSALTYTLSEGIFRKIRYDAVSVLSDLLVEQGMDRGAYLQMPREKDMAPTRDLVKTLSSGRTREETAQAILHFLRDGQYRYSLKNLPISDNPLEEFLFRHKYGNCEYFASAMAVMLRFAGIPSRVVGGYKGGYYNDAGAYYLVPQKNAHVWVEAYMDNRGWLRMDPTPAGIETFVSGSSDDLFFRVKILLDSMNYYWNVLVINYDLTKQISLFHHLRSGIRNPRIYLALKSKAAARYSAALLCLTLVVVVICRLALRRRVPHEKMLDNFLKRMRRYGYDRDRSEGLEEFAARIGNGEMRAKAFRFVRAFEEYYYRDRKLSKEDLRKLRLLLDMEKEQ